MRTTVLPVCEFSGILGASPAMLRVFAHIRKYASDPAALLITGESGTGKELVARAIRDNGMYRDKRYVILNCAAFPETLLESELFGHTRGAFTGAVRDRVGRVEAADGGILFLDEIGDMAVSLQAKLLRLLENHTIERIGENASRPVNVRILAATARNLQEDVAHGRFRLDLFYRLNVLNIRIPPLRGRTDDISLLVDHYLTKEAARRGRPGLRIGAAARKHLLSYDYPGNVRELSNIIIRAIVLEDGPVISAEAVKDALYHSETGFDETEAESRALAEARRAETEDPDFANGELDDIEFSIMQDRLRHFGGSLTKTAESLGISRTSLYRMLRRSR